MNTSHLKNNIYGLLIAALFGAAWPMDAFAQDLAATVSNLTGKELTNIPDLINAVFYIGGAAYVGAGLLKAKQHTDNPQTTKLGEAVGRISVGGAMLALPYVASASIQTFAFGNSVTPYTSFSQVH